MLASLIIQMSDDCALAFAAAKIARPCR